MKVQMVGFKSKFSKQIGVGVAKLATENRRCSVVLESLSHNGKPPLPGFELGRPRPFPVPDFQSEKPGDALHRGCPTPNSEVRPFEFERNF